ncbi:hypothetical protein OJAV_G00168210 [Oryzias javanicus]|uniref:Secreted protein n=1 Tax=Oryzias javanicus TaxID=123683 RepID=A0A437CG54_ORYJA|nr:hypothetical protein OJAV_G00168210 [Oryzias javanicus]
MLIFLSASSSLVLLSGSRPLLWPCYPGVNGGCGEDARTHTKQRVKSPGKPGVATGSVEITGKGGKSGGKRTDRSLRTSGGSASKEGPHRRPGRTITPTPGGEIRR